MSSPYDEQHEVEQLRKWLNENWLPLGAGLALGLAAILSWQAWNRAQDAHAADGSRIYADLGRATDAGRYGDAAAMADALVKDYSSTPYAAAGALKAAEAAVLAAKFDDAAARLQWVVDYENRSGPLLKLEGALHLHLIDNPHDPALASLARLRLAQVLLQQHKPDDALKQLDGNPGSYAALYDQLRGDIKLSQGDRAAARGAYQQALQALSPDEAVSRDGLQRKLDDLADAAAEHS